VIARPLQLRVVVCHPGRQYSHQLALALADANLLAKYLTGVPTHPQAGGRLGTLLLAKWSDVYAIPLDHALVEHSFISPLVRRLGNCLHSRRLAVDLAHRGDRLFDLWAARRIEQLRPDVVVAYENCALHTFRAAKTIGATTVLDAASFHHGWQDRFLRPETFAHALDRINRAKDIEIELADHIITVSEFARQSYLEAGIAADRLTAIPLGVDTDLFRYEASKSASREAKVNFAFVGQLSNRKGTDVLLAAARILTNRGINFTLTLFGNPSQAYSFDDLKNCRVRGWLGHRELATELAQCDVLVLPSRHDSFGMVVAEAMACGLPAIVSDCVGAKEMISPAVNGHVVPAGDADVLADAMRWYVERPNQLAAMGKAARKSAQLYGWPRYREQVVKYLSEIGAQRIIA
jgi:glycosyltransferase involved in cell wall biosynthesis